MSILDEWSKEDRRFDDEPTPKTNPNPIPMFDRTLPEIAEILGVSVNTAKNQYRSGVKKILERHPELREWL
jgi:hypothetical protein